jgi:GAF domain-containing protein
MGEPQNARPRARVGDDKLAQLLAEMARTVEHEDSLDTTLEAIVRAAVDMVPGAQMASITEVRRRQELSVRLATDDIAGAADVAQYQAGDGPCLTSAYDHVTVHAPSLPDDRWPAFSQRAVELGLASLLAVQLYVHGDDLGALNLYSTEPDAFDDESEHVALLFATHAAVAMAGAHREQGLQRAIVSRDTIGQAKGRLMERYGIDADTAFRLLVRISQDANVKLAVVADAVAETGRIPSG